ncbi:MAG: hypothetical protein AAF494_03930 [Pseudomonadota bacterium]
MSDKDAEIQTNMASASQSLRDTAKWIVGGLIGAAALIFTGSSLSKFGLLAATPDPWRLIAAVAGAIVGFVGIALLMRKAFNVLTHDPISFKSMADPESCLLEFEQESDAKRKFGFGGLLDRLIGVSPKARRNELLAIRMQLNHLTEDWELPAGSIQDVRSIWQMRKPGQKLIHYRIENYFGDAENKPPNEITEDEFDRVLVSSKHSGPADSPGTEGASDPIDQRLSKIEEMLKQQQEFLAALKTDDLGRVFNPHSTPVPGQAPDPDCKRDGDDLYVKISADKAEQVLWRTLDGAGALLVKLRFRALRFNLFISAPLMILGFGTFAWAVSPGENYGKPKAQPQDQTVVEVYNADGKLTERTVTRTEQVDPQPEQSSNK